MPYYLVDDDGIVHSGPYDDYVTAQQKNTGRDHEVVRESELADHQLPTEADV